MPIRPWWQPPHDPGDDDPPPEHYSFPCDYSYGEALAYPADMTAPLGDARAVTPLPFPAGGDDGVEPTDAAIRAWVHASVQAALTHAEPPLCCVFCFVAYRANPEAMRLPYHEVTLAIVNGAPFRSERRKAVPCCLACWRRLAFTRWLVECGRLSDWPGGDFHHIQATKPPVCALEQELTEEAV